ncbi:MAG: sigma-70 family RNA polymerase sigma factor [Planctomycetota bacterium]|nr:sigma-70 family RNA polymerase sigma factor [Planctomycetota bacterium]
MARRIESLFRRYRDQGDVRALGLVFDRTADELLRVAMHFAGDPSQAEEWLQQTWLIAIDRADGWDGQRPLTPWLLGILRNVVRRTHAARTQEALPKQPLRAPTTSDVVAEMEWTTLVAEAVERLPDPYRSTLILRLQHGLEPAEIARLERRPPATVRSHIHRGLLKLKAELPQESRPRALNALAAPLGLLHIRAQVLSAAQVAAPAAAAGSAATSAALSGGILMQKLVLAAVAVAAILLVLTDPLDWRSADVPSERDPVVASGGPTDPDAPVPELDGVGPTPTDVTPEASRPGPDVDLDAIDRDLDVHGIVRLKDGTPVVGARVQLFDAPWRDRGVITNPLGEAEWAAGPSTRSGRQGTFKFRLREGEQRKLRVSADGFVPRTILRVRAGERVDIVLDDAVAIRIRVLAPGGGPGAAVPISLVGAEFDGTIETDAEGVAYLEGLAPGKRIAFWAHPQRAGWGVSRWARVTLPKAGTHEHELQLPEGRTLRGVVSDRATGHPIAGARVGMNWTLHPMARTDDDGRYMLHGWTGKGIRDLHVLADGYGRVERFVGDASTVDFVLDAATSIRGRVVDEDGAPIARAWVAVVGAVFERGSQQISMANGWADDQGRFTLADLVADLPHTVIVRAPGYGRRHVDVDAVVKGTKDIGDVVLGPPHTIVGRVYLPNGEPARGLEVRVKGANADRAAGRESGAPAQRSYGHTDTAKTDDLGRFVVTGLCAGQFTLLCRQPNGPEVEVSVRLTEGTRRRTVNIQLVGTRELTVRVLDPDGEPVTDGYVEARAKSSIGRPTPRVTANLNALGVAVLNIPSGYEHVRVIPFTLQGVLDPGRQPIPSDTNELVIRLERAVTIEGVLLDPHGRPIPRALLSGRMAGAYHAAARTDADGRFAMRCARTDVLEIRFDGQIDGDDGSSDASGFRGVARGVRAGARDVRIQTYALRGQLTLPIRVLDPEGRSVSGARVQLDPDLPGHPVHTTDANGRVLVEGLSAVPRKVFVYLTPKTDGSFWLSPPTTGTPGTEEVVVRLETPLRITGRVRFADGSNAAKVHVRLFDDAGSTRPRGTGYTQKDGSFFMLVSPSLRACRMVARKTIKGVKHRAELEIERLSADAPYELQLERAP